MSATIMRLEQGSPEWLAHRAKYRNASETPAVMGVSPWQTPYGLWLERTGRHQRPVTAPMKRGRELEVAARRAYERLTGVIVEPLVLVDGAYSASLDGLSFDGDLVVEIKAPWRGADSPLWQAVQDKELPEYVGAQVQHQLMVASAELAHVYVFDGQRGVLLEQRPDAAAFEQIRRDWDEFWKYLEQDSPPPLCDRDARQRDDEAWRAAADAYLRAKREADASETALEQAKGALVALTTHPRESGAGVSVTLFWKRGAVDYKAVPALNGVDLEAFREESKLEVRVTAV